jgi:hypothetical protein
MKLLLALTLFLIASGCARQSSVPAPLPPGDGSTGTASSLRDFLKKASAPEIRRRAIAQAQYDIRAGTPHVAWSGGYALDRPNIPADKERLVAGLPPVKGLPAGCTDPLLMKGVTYATAYNGELVKHLPLAKSR